MITWSPVSTWGAKIGLCLPRRTRATSVATRPSTRPSASTTCQARVMSAGFGVYVGTRVFLYRSPGDGKDYGATAGMGKRPSTSVATCARRRNAARQTNPLARAATAPIISAQRVSKVSAIEPDSGPPIGVDPRNRIEYSAMTRPRIAGIEVSCSALMVADKNAMPAKPAAAQAKAAVHGFGAMAIRAEAAPKATDIRARKPLSVVVRRATHSEPVSEPTLNTVVMKA